MYGCMGVWVWSGPAHPHTHTPTPTHPHSAPRGPAMRSKLLLTAVLLSLAAPALARKAVSGPLDLGKRAMADRKYDDAVREFTAAVTLGGTKADEAQLMLAYALYYQKKYPEAIAACDRLLKERPGSKWRRKALFRKADCCVALKQYDQAAAIYEPELAHLVSDARKEQVADT